MFTPTEMPAMTTTDLSIGSLFSGYGGLDRAIEEVFGARTAWVSDIDKGACKVLAHRFPHAPNLGDITRIDWATVEPVDIIAGGSPCQDLSAAGRRAGMTDGTRSNLWVQMREAIATLKPTFVVWENVRGSLSATAASGLEYCPGCMGNPADGGPVLRALGRVLGDLSDLGYDTEWRGLRASDVGACHHRFRIFVLAWRREALADPDQPRLQGLADPPRAAQTGRHGHPVAGAGRSDLTLLPTPIADNSRGLPSTGTDFQSLPNEVVHRWGDYAAAITRHEQAIGRPAPPPTEPGHKGQPRLSARFVEWMMMLPAGWITDVPGVTRNEALKLAGNGVVPPQAAAALRDMRQHITTGEPSSMTQITRPETLEATLRRRAGRWAYA